MSHDSPGVVQADEHIARSVFSPMHIKDGKVRVNFIRRSDLQSGSLSVWRVEQLGDQLNAQLQKYVPPKQELLSILAPPVGDVRELASKDSDRGFCVVDDPESGPDETHPAHAVLRVCRNAQDDLSDELNLRFIQEALRDLFLKHPLRV